MVNTGKEFENICGEILKSKFGISAEKTKIMIGYPPKYHEYDLVSDDQGYICECKDIRWTKEGNVPSAKIHSLNEAVLLLQHLPNYEDAKTIIFLPKDIKTYKSGKQVALADYYFGRFAHVLGRVKIIEGTSPHWLDRKWGFIKWGLV